MKSSIEIEFSDLKDVIYPKSNTNTNSNSIMDSDEVDVSDPSSDEFDIDDASEAATISRMNSNNSFVKNSDSNSSFRDCAFDNDDNCFKN